MTVSEIVSVVSVCSALVGLMVTLFVTSHNMRREKSQDDRENTERLIRIDDNVRNISGEVASLKEEMKVTKTEFNSLNVTVAQHETRLTNVEHEVFKRKGE